MYSFRFVPLASTTNAAATATMEGLLAEINKKKSKDFTAAKPEEKYLSRGEKERLREEAERAEHERREAEREAAKKRKADEDQEERATKMRKEVSWRYLWTS